MTDVRAGVLEPGKESETYSRGYIVFTVTEEMMNAETGLGSMSKTCRA